MKTRTILSACAMLAGAGLSQAQQVNLYGDLGPQAATGIVFSPINSTNTFPFTWSAPAGNITGDVIVTNNLTGNNFDITITNLTYNCIIPNLGGFGDVILVVQHSFATSGSGTYVGQQSLAGSWTSGPLSVVQLDSLQDFGGANVYLPSLIATTSPFNLGPVSGTLLSSSPVYTIQAVLRLETDGVGAINLPSSAHISATLTPAPGSLALLGLGGIATLRRRRS